MTSKSAFNFKIKLNLKCLLVIFLIFLLIFVEAVNSGGYVDEILGAISIAYIIVSARRLQRTDLITFVLLAIVVAIGLVSNMIFRLNTSLFSILVDVLTQVKPIFVFFAAKYFLNANEKITVANMLAPVAKLFCLITFVCAVVSQFVDIGMTSGEVRYGITVFRFIFEFNHQYTSVYMLVFGVLVSNTSMSGKVRKRYYVIAIISILFAAKSPALIFTVVFVFLYFYFKKHNKLKVWVIILLAIALIFAGTYQINEYLLNENAPRRVFFEYAFKTANDYFPLGSGFATYGSEQAKREYSPLYYQYGFDTMWGLGPNDGFFLNDNYWPTVIGQFGWIGTIFMLAVYVKLFFTFANKKMGNAQKAYLYGAFVQYMVHAIGSAILTSSAGMIGIIAIALFSVTEEKEDSAMKLPRVKIHF